LWSPSLSEVSLLRKKNSKKAVKKTVERWSSEERNKFLLAVEIFEDNWDKVE